MINCSNISAQAGRLSFLPLVPVMISTVGYSISISLFYSIPTISRTRVITLMSAPPQAIAPNPHTHLLNVYIQIANKMGFQTPPPSKENPYTRNYGTTISSGIWLLSSTIRTSASVYIFESRNTSSWIQVNVKKPNTWWFLNKLIDITLSDKYMAYPYFLLWCQSETKTFHTHNIFLNYSAFKYQGNSATA
jgi:hypothetical protein